MVWFSEKFWRDLSSDAVMAAKFGAVIAAERERERENGFSGFIMEFLAERERGSVCEEIRENTEMTSSIPRLLSALGDISEGGTWWDLSISI